MTSDEDKEQESPGIKPAPESDFKKTPKSYSYLKRPLKEEELLNPGAVNLLIDDLMRLQQDSDELKELDKRFNEIDKENGVLQHRLRTHKSTEVLQSLSLALGSMMIGASKSLWTIGYVGVILLVLGGCLTIAAVLSKATGLTK